jgi:hypothetical protein
MTRKINATALAECGGVECLRAADIDADSIIAARVQFFSRHGIPQNRVGLFGSLYFGEPKQ